VKVTPVLLAHRIAQYTPDMKREDVENSFRSAFRIWSDMAPLTFVRVNHGKADIILHFARRSINKPLHFPVFSSQKTFPVPQTGQ